MKCRPLPISVIVAIAVASTSAHPAPARSRVIAARAGAPAAASPVRRFDNPVLHVEVTGHGRPLVFLPGLASSGDVWRDAVARYADRYECHVVTLGGFAGQPRFEGPFLATARDSLLAYFHARGLAAPVVIGHSLGGVLALQLGISDADAIGGIVIVDALPFLGGAGRPDATVASAQQAMAPLRDMIRGQSQESYAAFQKQSPYLHAMVTGDADFARVLDWTMRSDRIAVADAMYEVGTIDLRDRLDALRAPVLVLGSWSADHSTRDAVAATFRAQYAKAGHWSLALADSARHFLMLDAPEWTWTHVDTFLAGVDGSPLRGGGR